jgi:hypothetical protein
LGQTINERLSVRTKNLEASRKGAFQTALFLKRGVSNHSIPRFAQGKAGGLENALP